MWNTIKEYIIRRLIGMKEDNLEIGRYDNIDEVEKWSSIYEGTPPWDKEVKISGIATSIVSSLAKKVTIEMESRVVDSNGEQSGVKAEYLDKQYQKLVDRTRANVEHLLVHGGAILRPYVTRGKIVIEYILPDRFIPLRFNESGELVEVIFIDRIVRDKKTYTKLETHILKDDGNYTILHTFHIGEGISDKGEISNPVSESLMPEEWVNSDFDREFHGEGFEYPLFVYMRNPAANNKDVNSPLGVSIYSQVERTLEEYDRLYDNYLWEFQGGELKLFGSKDFIRQNPNALSLTSQVSGGYRSGESLGRLFVALDMDPQLVDDPLRTFNPDFREKAIYAGMEKLLRTIEFDIGLGYGELSAINEREKTAEEIRAGKQRTHTTIVDIQKEIKRAYNRVLEIMEIYVDLGGDYETLVEQSAVNDVVELTWTFDDSIVVDRKSLLEGMLEDVKEGIIPREIYIIEKYGVSEQEAIEMVQRVDNAQVEEVVKDELSDDIEADEDNRNNILTNKDEDERTRHLSQ